MEDYFCELCSARGLRSRLVSHQVNFDEVTWLCEVKDCLYPVGCKQLSPQCIAKRRLSESSNSKKKKKKRKTAKSKIQPIKSSKSTAKERPVEFFVQWQNADALCWLHSVLSLIVHNSSLRLLLEQTNESSQSLPRTLLEKYDLAQKQFATSQKLATRTLKEVQKLVWNYLEPKMKCTLGMDDSPVAALPLIMRESQVTADHCTQEFKWNFCCSVCGYQKITEAKRILVTFPNISDDFCMPHGAFVRSCYRCNAPGQKTVMEYKKMPDCIFVHFVEGLKSKAFLETKFSGEDGSLYAVTQFIHYSRDPDHFSCWAKEDQGTRWLEMDDTKPSRCHWSHEPPTVPPSEVHIVVWEKVRSEKDSLTSVTEVTLVEKSTMLKDISNCDHDKQGGTPKRSCLVNDVCKSASKKAQNSAIGKSNHPLQCISSSNKTALAKAEQATPLCRRSRLSAEKQEVKPAEVSNLSVRSVPISNGTILAKVEQATPLSKTSFSGSSSLSAEMQERKPAEVANLSGRCFVASNETALVKVEQAAPLCRSTPFSGRSSLTAELHKRKSVDISDLSLQSNGTALASVETVIPLCKAPISGCRGISAESHKRKSMDVSDLSLQSNGTALANEETVIPSCKAPISGRGGLPFELHKRKSTKFEPYVPRKLRILTQSNPSPLVCHEPKQELPVEKLDKVKPKGLFLSWPEVEEHSGKTVRDDASDSGYSSNLSNPGSVNSLDGQTNVEHLSPDTGDTQRERDLASKLEELLPDCLLVEPSPKLPLPVNLESTLKTLSAEQDQFLLDLLAT